MIKNLRSTADTGTLIYPSRKILGTVFTTICIGINIYGFVMCYMYMDVCIICGRQEIFNMQLCTNRMRVGICLSYEYNTEVFEEEGQTYMKVPVEKNSITYSYELRLTDLIHTEYSDMICYTCEDNRLYSGVEEFED